MTKPDWLRNWEVTFSHPDTGEFRTDYVEADNREEAIRVAREQHDPKVSWKLSTAAFIIDASGGQAPTADDKDVRES